MNSLELSVEKTKSDHVPKQNVILGSRDIAMP
jgi:hypothetical protein